jgi:hypothetical protein
MPACPTWYVRLNSLTTNAVKKTFLRRSTLALCLHIPAQASNRRVKTTTSATATESPPFEEFDEGKNKSRLNYAYRALVHYCCIAAHVERERPAVGQFVFVPGNGAEARIGRAV